MRSLSLPVLYQSLLYVVIEHRFVKKTSLVMRERNQEEGHLTHCFVAQIINGLRKVDVSGSIEMYRETFHVFLFAGAVLVRITRHLNELELNRIREIDDDAKPG